MARGAAPQTVPQLLQKRVADSAPVAILRGEQGPALTYERWHRGSLAVARGLGELGATEGDRIAMRFAEGDWPEFMIGYVGLQWLGATALPLPTGLGADLAQEHRDRCGAELEISCAQVLDWIDRYSAPSFGDRTPNAVATGVAEILPTSGTTGESKLVACTHENLCVGDGSQPIMIDPSGRPELQPFVHFVPIGTSAGQKQVLRALRGGDSTFVNMQSFDPERLQALVKAHSADRLALVPATAAMLVSSGVLSTGFESVTSVYLSSAPSSPELVQEISTLLPSAVINNIYGLTEAGWASIQGVFGAMPDGALGRPSFGTRVTIRDPESGQDIAVGCEGEIWIGQTSVPQRWYLDDRESSAATFRDGLVRTGDLGWMDPLGHVYLTGRLKEAVTIGGLTLAPADIERRLMSHPQVRDAAVFGLPHPRMGEQLAASVVVNEPISAGELRWYVRQSLGSTRTPVLIEFLPELPRTHTGKISKWRLKDSFGLANRSSEIASPVSDGVAAVFRSVLALDQFPTDGNFFSLGGHSLLALESIELLQLRFGVTFTDPGLLFDNPTPLEMARVILMLKASQGKGEVPSC